MSLWYGEPKGRQEDAEWTADETMKHTYQVWMDKQENRKEKQTTKYRKDTCGVDVA